MKLLAGLYQDLNVVFLNRSRLIDPVIRRPVLYAALLVTGLVFMPGSFIVGILSASEWGISVGVGLALVIYAVFGVLASILYNAWAFDHTH